jgi:hypothetical protein
VAKEKYTVEKIVLPDLAPVAVGDSGVVMHRYMPRGEVPAPGVVVLPIQGGDYEISTMFAKYLARVGFQALRFERRDDWLDPEKEIVYLGELMKQYLADILRGIDWWLTEAEDGPAHLGLFGVSMGANMGTIIAAREPRLKGQVFIIGGGDIAGILATANDEEINEYRKNLSARLGIEESQLAPLFHEVIDPIDNLNEAAGVNEKTTLFVSSRFDAVVRYPYNSRLWEAMGRPKRIVLPCGHYSTVVFVPLIKLWTKRWFRKLLT